jgi:hypothetical protein
MWPDATVWIVVKLDKLEQRVHCDSSLKLFRKIVTMVAFFTNFHKLCINMKIGKKKRWWVLIFEYVTRMYVRYYIAYAYSETNILWKCAKVMRRLLQFMLQLYSCNVLSQSI